jgi:hypothetical protein
MGEARLRKPPISSGRTPRFDPAIIKSMYSEYWFRPLDNSLC